MMDNGIYFLMPEGSAWIAARIVDGACVDSIAEADAATYTAANDSIWANVAPCGDDILLDPEDADEIVALVLGDSADPRMVVVTRAAPTYVLEMRDEGGSSETVDFGTSKPTARDIEEACEEWVKGGEWGNDGAIVSTRWSLMADEDEVDSGSTEVEIEPDHAALISAAGGDPECEHQWTSKGEGGCDQNPGVWATGGTSMTFASHCKLCGLHRVEYSTGSQRNPGEHDTVEYEQPANWCAECQSEECSCEAVEAE